MKEKCPELLENMSIQSYLFAPTKAGGTSTSGEVDTHNSNTMDVEDESSVFHITNKASEMTQSSTPMTMATKFHVNYLGQLPMDRNLMLSCEAGVSFIETYPESVAIQPLLNIVQKIINHVEK